MCYEMDAGLMVNIKREIESVIDEIDESIKNDVTPSYEEFNVEFLEGVLNSLNEIRGWW